MLIIGHMLFSGFEALAHNFFPQCAIYAQDLRKIVLISPMRSICATFAQDCTSFSNVQRLQALLEEIRHISHISSKYRMVFTS